MQAGILGFVNHTHATAKFFENAIVGEGLARLWLGLGHLRTS
jgi:hypothetical protein